MSFDSKFAILIPGIEAPDSAQLRNRASDALTARERDILAMISQGLSNKRIARALKISPETVKSHVKHILSKLAVSTRGAAAFQAGSLGLLRLPEPMPKENAIASSGDDGFHSAAAHRGSPQTARPIRGIFEQCS